MHFYHFTGANGLNNTQILRYIITLPNISLENMYTLQEKGQDVPETWTGHHIKAFIREFLLLYAWKKGLQRFKHLDPIIIMVFKYSKYSYFPRQLMYVGWILIVFN